MYSDNRDAYRQLFYLAWQKYQKNLPLDATEQQLVEVISAHPEYHPLLNNEKDATHEFALEENPFLHMSLHIALREQIKLNRPTGIQEVYQRLLLNRRDEHAVEHLMTACLAQILWAAQRTGVAPDENDYLMKLQDIA